MSIKLGTNDLKELYLGNIKIKSAYFGNIAVFSDFVNNPYFLTLLSNQYGTLLADSLSGYNGDVVHLTTTPNDDCHFIDYDSTACEIVGDNLTFSNSDCTAQANFGRNVHNVTTLTSNYGSISVNKNTGYSGDTFTLSNTPNADCTFGSYSVTGATLTSNQFMMQKEDVSAQGTFNRNSHNITLQTDGHGKLSASKTTGYSGDTISLATTASGGYAFSGYTITGATLTSNQFKVGTSNVTAKAWFKYNIPTVKIGTQIWSKNNIQIDDGGTGIYKFNNVTSAGVNWGTQYYYTTGAAVRIANLIPGWRLPTIADIDKLRSGADASAGNGSYAGKCLKTTTGWYRSGHGIDKFGFSGAPVGYCNTNGQLRYVSYYVYYPLNSGNSAFALEYGRNTITFASIFTGNGISACPLRLIQE